MSDVDQKYLAGVNKKNLSLYQQKIPTNVVKK